MSTADMQREVDMIYPKGKPVTLKGKEVTVMPYGFGKYPKVLEALAILAGNVDGKAAVDAAQSDNNILRDLVLKGGEQVVVLCHLAIDQPRKYFDDLPADEGLELVKAVLEVNRDFFVNKIGPKLTEIIGSLSELAGVRSLLDSSRTDTD